MSFRPVFRAAIILAATATAAFAQTAVQVAPVLPGAPTGLSGGAAAPPVAGEAVTTETASSANAGVGQQSGASMGTFGANHGGVNNGNGSAIVPNVTSSGSSVTGR